MTMTLFTVPTMRELLTDEVFAEYMRKRPRLPENVRHGEPWRVLAKRVSDAERAIWGLTDVATYEEAFRRTMSLLDKPEKWADVVLISKRKFMAPPKGFDWDLRWMWCGRCRRPSEFTESYKRPAAMRDAPAITMDEPIRCVLCGVRKSFVPHYQRRF